MILTYVFFCHGRFVHEQNDAVIYANEGANAIYANAAEVNAIYSNIR